MLRKFQNKSGETIYLNLIETDVASITYTADGSTLIKTRDGSRHVVKESPEEVARQVRSKVAFT